MDHHCHLSVAGALDAARRFARAGGTHLFLATQQYGEEPPASLDEYRVQFETTEAIARKVTESTGVSVYRVVAPYPVDLVKLAERIGLPEAQRVLEAATELAGRWVEEGRAVALGEVGRPHFSVEASTAVAAEALFRRSLEVARDVGCPVVVHCEDLDAAGYHALAEFAARAGFPLGRLVKHYARSYVPLEDRAGVVPSFLASRELVSKSLGDAGPWFWETDYLDDPRRPGAVLDLATVPRRANQAALSEANGAEALRTPFERSVRAVYGFTPSVGDQGRPK